MPDALVPEVIARYLNTAPSGDAEAVVTCFTDDAVVLDEGQTFRGHSEIRRWRDTVTSKFAYTILVVGAQALDSERCVVTGELEGNFPGSPVVLKFQFSLRDELIAGLEIAP